MKKHLAFLASLAIATAFLTACTRPPGKPVEPAVNSDEFDYRNYSEVLIASVDKYGAIDYEGVKRDREKLRAFVTSLSQVDLGKLPGDQARVAFWINAYNALVLSDAVDLIYQKLPDVRRVPGFFDQRTHSIAGENITLDAITRKAAASNDARVHFALGCPTRSCPRLQTEPFTGSKLDAQLSKCAREFLADQGRGLLYDGLNNRVFISQLFKWNASDFLDRKSQPAEPNARDMFASARRFLPPNVNNFFSEKQPEARYMEYDWSLNTKQAGKPSPAGLPPKAPPQ